MSKYSTKIKLEERKKDMYKNVIEIKKNITEEKLKILSEIADKAFNNRAGKVENISNTPYCFIYRGGDKEYACLEVGMLNLKRDSNFLSSLEAWNWIDEDDSTENEDILSLFNKKILEDNNASGI